MLGLLPQVYVIGVRRRPNLAADRNVLYVSQYLAGRSVLAGGVSTPREATFFNVQDRTLGPGGPDETRNEAVAGLSD